MAYRYPPDTEVEVDCGPLPVYEATFIISDPTVTTNTKLVASISGNTPTGKDADEVSMDSFVVLATPLDGQVQIYLRGLEGYIADKFKIVYSGT